MAGIAQKRTKLSGKWYEAGEIVPSELCSRRLVDLGLIAIIPDDSPAAGGGATAVELERTKKELADALAALEAARVPAPLPAFNPDEHKVDEVLAYVEGAPDDVERVRNAEAGGQARKTLLKSLDDLLAAQSDPADVDDDDAESQDAAGESQDGADEDGEPQP
jgi:hypothetical protein